MNANVESPSSSPADIIKWIAVVAILVAMVVANNMYGESSMLIRAVVFVVAVSACLGIASTTVKGQTFIKTTLFPLPRDWVLPWLYPFGESYKISHSLRNLVIIKT